MFLVIEATNFEERLRALEVQFSARLAEADARIAKVERERDEYKKLNALLQEEVERLQARPARAKGGAAAEE